MADTLYDLPHILGISTLSRPRDLADVGRALAEIERWGNTIPWLGLTHVGLPVQQTMSATTFTDVTGFAASVTPTRVGQTFLVLVQMRCDRSTGTAIVNLRGTLSVNGGTPATLGMGDWYIDEPVGGYSMGVLTFTASTLGTHTVQIQARITGGASSWFVRVLGSNLTILAL